jgi:hypothetical protein
MVNTSKQVGEKQKELIKELLDGTNDNYFKLLLVIVEHGKTPVLESHLNKIWSFIKLTLQKDISEGGGVGISVNHRPLYKEWLYFFNKIVPLKLFSLDQLLEFVKEFDFDPDPIYDDEMLMCYNLLLKEYPNNAKIISEKIRIESYIESEIKKN